MKHIYEVTEKVGLLLSLELFLYVVSIYHLSIMFTSKGYFLCYKLNFVSTLG